jgi:RimJ/RimL family protein N-acetyltransferase
MKSLIRSMLHAIFADYRINWIVAAEPDTLRHKQPSQFVPIIPLSDDHCQRLLHSETDKMRNAVSQAKGGLTGFVIADNAQPICVAHFATRAQYEYMSTWPITQSQIALMDIATEEDFRGRGLAVQMIEAMTMRYMEQGYDKIIAFIWWSNAPSVRAFSKAGWKKIGFSVEILVADKWRSLRVPIFWA